MHKIKERGKAMPGTEYILDYFSKRGFTIALATSSPLRLAKQVVEQLNIGSYFSLLQSAELLPYGKPHPEVYMQCAAALEVNPLQCLCFEDSFNGMIAAKAAKMKCVVVPEHSLVHHAQWGAADLKMSSLQNFNDLLLQQL
jgi:sugar-phosphatase